MFYIKNKIVMRKLFILFICGFLCLTCNSDKNNSDAYGNFESVEMIMSAEASGKILKLDLNEGQVLKKGQVLGYIDTIQLHLKKLQLNAQIASVSSKVGGILAQINISREQKKNLIIEKDRIDKLFAEGTATQQQVDNIHGQLNVIERQIESIQTQNSGILNEIESLQIQKKMVEDQIEKSKIVNPTEGTVMEKYMEESEIVGVGKPIYKLANLSTVFLRIYVSGKQLDQIKIGQQVNVSIDHGEKGFKEFTGKISWVSTQCEFTPKIIQTKEERVNMVYAVKVEVVNDGSIKIGMPGEVRFN